LVGPGLKVQDNVYIMTLSHQGQRGRLLTYVCILPYTVLRYCKVVVGFRVRIGYLCGTCGVHEDRYDLCGKDHNIIYVVWLLVL
jgi:hypothetical protein